MSFPLLVIMVCVAVAITVIGFFLSFKDQEPQRPIRRPLPQGGAIRRSVGPERRPVQPGRGGRAAMTTPIQRAALSRSTGYPQPTGYSQAITRARASQVQPTRTQRLRGVEPRYSPRYTIDLYDDQPAWGGAIDQIWRPGDWVSSRQAVVMGLLVIVLCSSVLLTRLLPHQSMLGFMPFYGVDTSTTNSNTTTQKPAAPIVKAVASKLQRLSQLDRDQYDSDSEYNTWAYSSCSSASMTEVFNSYGHGYRVTDILKIESGIHEITADEGLLENIGVARTATKFGFNTEWGDNGKSVDEIVNIANKGHPVIISFPPGRNPQFSSGHILVVKGGDKDTVYMADSSLYNHTAYSRSDFAEFWGGFYAIPIPK